MTGGFPARKALLVGASVAGNWQLLNSGELQTAVTKFLIYFKVTLWQWDDLVGFKSRSAELS